MLVLLDFFSLELEVLLRSFAGILEFYVHFKTCLFFISALFIYIPHLLVEKKRHVYGMMSHFCSSLLSSGNAHHPI